MAKRFHFRLETVLRVRELREREAKRRVGAKQSEIAQLDRLDDETRTLIRSQESDLLRLQQQERVEPAHIARIRAWVAHLRTGIAQRALMRGKLTTELSVLQEELRSARVQTRILEKLREKRYTEHRADSAQREQRAADEVAQRLHIVRAAESLSGSLAVET